MKMDNPYLLFKKKNMLFWVSLPILYILSLVYALSITVLKFLYRIKLLPSYRPACKVLSVGNITVGGAGKTPLVEWMAEYLRENGKKPGIIIRGYKRPKSKNSDIIAKSNKYFDIGDEACMLKDNLVDVPIAIGRDKIKSAAELEKLGNQPLILDDGFQHWRLRRDLDIVAVDCSQAFPNQMLLPLGRLREPLGSLKRADVFVLTKTDFSAENTEKTKAALSRINPEALIVTSIYEPQCFHDLKSGEDLPVDSPSLKQEPVFILAGIANPIYFDKLISGAKLKIKREFVYPDHYEYKDNDIDFIRLMAQEVNVNTIVTTQKDAVRIRHFFRYSDKLNVYYLKIKLKVTQNEEEFRDRILSVSAG